MARFIYILCLCLAFSSFSQVNFESIGWKQALTKAKKENKLIFISACTSWSEPCQALTKYTFNDLEVGNFFNENFINLDWNMEQYPEVEFAELFEIDLYPSLLFVNAEGEIVHRGCGSMEASELVDLAAVAQSDENLRYYQENLMENRSDPELVLSYFQLLEEACLDVEKEAQSFLKETSFKELQEESAFLVFEHYQWDIFSESFKYVRDGADDFRDQFGQDRVDEKLFNTYYNQYVEIYESEELHLFAMRALLNELADLDFSGADTLQLLAKLHYAEITEDWVAFADLVPKWIALEQSSEQEINDYAWKFYLFVEEQEKLKLAAGWVKEVIEENASPSFIDTYASLRFKLGKVKEAIELEKQALELAKELEEDTTHYQHQLEKFQAG